SALCPLEGAFPGGPAAGERALSGPRGTGGPPLDPPRRGSLFYRPGGPDSDGPNTSAAPPAADVLLFRVEGRDSDARAVIPRDVRIWHLPEGARRLPAREDARVCADDNRLQIQRLQQPRRLRRRQRRAQVLGLGQPPSA